MKITSFFNPKLSEFLIENPNKTLIGFWWSAIWRVYVVLIAIGVVIGMLDGIFGNQ